MTVPNSGEFRGGKFCSVKNFSNRHNFTKKRAKNGNFFSQKTGMKQAKLQNFNQKNWPLKKIQNFFLEIFLILFPFQMDFYLTLYNTSDIEKVTKNGQDHRKTGKKTGNFTKMPVKTGMPVLKRATLVHWFRTLPFLGGGKSWTWSFRRVAFMNLFLLDSGT